MSFNRCHVMSEHYCMVLLSLARSSQEQIALKTSAYIEDNLVREILVHWVQLRCFAWNCAI